MNSFAMNINKALIILSTTHVYASSIVIPTTESSLQQIVIEKIATTIADFPSHRPVKRVTLITKDGSEQSFDSRFAAQPSRKRITSIKQDLATYKPKPPLNQETVACREQVNSAFDQLFAFHRSVFNILKKLSRNNGSKIQQALHTLNQSPLVETFRKTVKQLSRQKARLSKNPTSLILPIISELYTLLNTVLIEWNNLLTNFDDAYPASSKP